MDGHFGGDFGGHHDSGHHGSGHHGSGHHHHHQDSDPAWIPTASGGGNPMAGRSGWIAAGVLLVLLIGLGLLAH